MRYIPKSITKQTIFELYCDQKKSVREIGIIVGKSPRQVSRYLDRFGIIARPFSTKGLKPRLGAKLSEISKEKIRQRALGRVISPDVRKKMGSKGDRNRHWIDGRTSVNKRIRHSVESKLWREAVFKRDNYTCQLCGKRGGNIQADHIKPFAYFPELRFAIDNGRTLCLRCHRKTDTFGHKAKKYLLK